MTEKQALDAAKKVLGDNVLAESGEFGERLVFGRENIVIRWEVEVTQNVTENIKVKVKKEIPEGTGTKTVIEEVIRPVTKQVTKKEPHESKEVREKISSTAETWDLALSRLLDAASRCEESFLKKPWPYY